MIYSDTDHRQESKLAAGSFRHWSGTWFHVVCDFKIQTHLIFKT